MKKYLVLVLSFLLLAGCAMFQKSPEDQELERLQRMARETKGAWSSYPDIGASVLNYAAASSDSLLVLDSTASGAKIYQLMLDDLLSDLATQGAIFKALAVADLGDAATPSVLTAAETTNKVISNYKSSGADHVFTMPACHARGNVIFTIGDEFQVDIEPDGSDLFYLNGTAMAADEHIQNTADTLGERIVGYCVSINGTLRWMFYSPDAAWVEETPP